MVQTNHGRRHCNVPPRLDAFVQQSTRHDPAARHTLHLWMRQRSHNPIKRCWGAARLDGRRALQWSDQAAFQRLGGTRRQGVGGCHLRSCRLILPIMRLYATAAALDNLASEVDAWEALLLEWKDANRFLCYHLTERYSTAVLRGLSFRQALCLPARRARSPRSAHLPPARIARSNITR